MAQRASRTEVAKILRDAEQRHDVAENALQAAAGERIAAYRFAAANGFSRAQIAEVVGVTRQRVEQIIKSEGR